MIIPVIKRQDDEYDFKLDIKDSKGEKIVKTWYCYMADSVLIGYSHESKAWEYHAIKEDKKLGLMSWVHADGVWKVVNADITKAYSDCVAEKALLKE